MARIKLVARLALWLSLGLLLTLRGVAAQPVKAGEGAYHLGPKGSDKGLPAAPLRTEAMLRQAAPTSQWYSTLIFNPKPFPIFVQPMTVRTTEQGFEMALPSKEVTPTDRRDTEVTYPHRDPLLLSPAGFEPVPPTLEDAYLLLMGAGAGAATALEPRVVPATSRQTAERPRYERVIWTAGPESDSRGIAATVRPPITERPEPTR